MNILVTNDDGINFIGLQTLVKHLSQIGDVYVCAPDSERSAFSHHFTYKGKMKLEERNVAYAKKAIALYATPVDCIHCSLQFLFKDIKFDLVVSGINKGWNVLSDAIYSGTVAAAREAYMQGIPAMAVSLDNYDTLDFEYSAEVAKELTLKHINNKNNKEFFLNVNIPSIPKEEIKGMKICYLEGSVSYDEGYYIEDNGIEKFVCTGKPTKTVLTPDGSDTEAIQEGYIALTPMYNDQVNHSIKNLEEIYINKEAN